VGKKRQTTSASVGNMSTTLLSHICMFKKLLS
jgi:hypothetical protein